MQDVYSPAVLDLAGDPGIEAFSSLQRELESEVDLLVSCYHRLLIPIQVWIQGLGESNVCTIWRAVFKKENTNHE